MTSNWPLGLALLVASFARRMFGPVDNIIKVEYMIIFFSSGLKKKSVNILSQ